MSTHTQAELISILNTAVVTKAQQDPAFRARLLADPKAAIEQALKVKLELPADLKLKVVEDGPQDHTIVLPYQPQAADGELSDADLESVAGGSKAGAKKFFDGFGKGLNNGYTSYKDQNSSEGKAGAVIGTIGSIYVDVLFG